MVDKIVAAAKYFTSRDVPGRNLKTQSDDTFLVSYPRSGNTWTRFLLANFVYPDAGVTLMSADRLIPNVDGQSKRYFEQMPSPRLIKTHYPFHPAYKRVIYIVRDPRDVAISQYHYQIKRGVLAETFPIAKFVSNFVAGDVCPYGSWGENVGTWLAARRSNPNFCLVRYEDLLRQTPNELARMARLLGIDPTSDRLLTAVERSTADRMRQLEKKEGSEWASTKGTRQDISFIRAAKSRQWKTALSDESIFEIENAWGDIMESLGYSPEHRPVEKLTPFYQPAFAASVRMAVPA